LKALAAVVAAGDDSDGMAVTTTPISLTSVAVETLVEAVVGDSVTGSVVDEPAVASSVMDVAELDVVVSGADGVVVGAVVVSGAADDVVVAVADASSAGVELAGAGASDSGEAVDVTDVSAGAEVGAAVI